MRSIQFVMIMLFVLSCKQADTIGQEDLYGKWNILKATRNGKETAYLRGGYLIIGQDGILTVNITGQDEKGKFQMEKNQLLMEGDKVFEITDFHQDSITINYNAAPNGQFVFYMAKSKEDAQ